MGCVDLTNLRRDRTNAFDRVWMVKRRNPMGREDRKRKHPARRREDDGHTQEHRTLERGPHRIEASQALRTTFVVEVYEQRHDLEEVLQMKGIPGPTRHGL